MLPAKGCMSYSWLMSCVRLHSSYLTGNAQNFTVHLTVKDYLVTVLQINRSGQLNAYTNVFTGLEHNACNHMRFLPFQHSPALCFLFVSSLTTIVNQDKFRVYKL